MVTKARSKARATQPTLASDERDPYGYVRVSTFIQAQEGFSLPHQFEICQDASRNSGEIIPPDNLLHDVDSGTKYARVGLSHLLDKVRARKVSIVYAPKVDRLGRNARDCLEILDILHTHETELVLVENNIDTRTPMGKLFFTLLAAFAEWEAELIRERTWSGKVAKTEQYHSNSQPFFAGGRYVPYGLQWTPPAKKGLEGCWTINQEQAQWVRFIYRNISLGSGYVAQQLNEKGVPSPTGGYWNDSTVRVISKSRTYIGEYVTRLRGKHYTFSVPAIIEPEVFTQAQEALTKNISASTRRSTHDYLLAGHIYCRTCQEEGRERALRCNFGSKEGRTWTYYHCNHRVEGKEVRHKVGGKKIEDAIWEFLCQTLHDPTVALENLQKLQDASTRQHQDLAQELTLLQAQAADLEKQVERLTLQYARGLIDQDILDRLIAEMREQLQENQSQQETLRTQLGQAHQSTLPLLDVEQACKLIATGLEEFDFTNRRWIVRSLVGRIWADQKGWQVEGRLPGLADGQGDYGLADNISTHTGGLSTCLWRVQPSGVPFAGSGCFLSGSLAERGLQDALVD